MEDTELGLIRAIMLINIKKMILKTKKVSAI